MAYPAVGAGRSVDVELVGGGELGGVQCKAQLEEVAEVAQLDEVGAQLPRRARRSRSRREAPDGATKLDEVSTR
ncbi:MAG TPA: hypothetical protein VH498_06715 [Candidatus Dormibacteraeota bacterium]|nr:hypothetical protein [Candidatus Dormibacteraeota bacterium]